MRKERILADATHTEFERTIRNKIQTYLSLLEESEEMSKTKKIKLESIDNIEEMANKRKDGLKECKNFYKIFY